MVFYNVPWLVARFLVTSTEMQSIMQGCVGSYLKPINTSLSYCWKSFWKSTMNAIPCPRPTTNLQGSSDTPPRRLQDASRTPSRRHKMPPSRLQDALKSFANRHEASSRLQRAPKTPQDVSKTPQPPPSSLWEASKTAQDVAKVVSKRYQSWKHNMFESLRTYNH